MSEFNFNPSFNFTPGGSGFNPGMDFNPAATTDFNPSEAAFDISKFEKDIEAPKQQQKQPPKP